MDDVVYRHCDTRLKGTSANPQDGMTRLDCPECGEKMHVKVLGWPNPDWPFDD